MTSKQKFGLILGPLLFIIIYFFISPAGMSKEAQAVLASTLWIAVWWITEAIPIPVTSLLPIVLFPLSGGLDIGATTKPYGSPMIFLFIGGFIIAVAIERWNLHRRIAMNIIKAIGTNVRMIILGFMIATALLSMWISNTATTLMMMPIAFAIITQLTDFLKENGLGDQEDSAFGKALMLSVAYAASIGGMATLIGTPTNIIFTGVARQLYGIEITFAQWFIFGFPVAVVLFFLAWLYLVKVAFSFKTSEIPGGKEEINKQLIKLGKMSYEEKSVLVVFLLTAAAWMTRSFVLNKLIPGINDTIIAIAGATLLFMIPAKSEPGKKILNWESAVKLPWGIILLFGGGLSLAAGFKDSGLASWIGDQFQAMEGIPFFIILLTVVAGVNFLTEITSNVATASMILPVLAALAMAISVHPFGLMIAACVAASCAFMLPVATPPNAVVFGAGYIRMQDMVRVGFFMNLVSILVLTLYVYIFLPLLWGFDLNTLPQMMQQNLQ